MSIIGKLVIKCAKCGNDEWIPIKEFSPKLPKQKVCSRCNAEKCFENEDYVWEESNGDECMIGDNNCKSELETYTQKELENELQEINMKINALEFRKKKVIGFLNLKENFNIE